MRIKHSITRTGCTLSGQILEVLFEEGEERGGAEEHYTEDKEFYIISKNNPEFERNKLYVHGATSDKDNDKVFYTYRSEQEAQQVLEYINEFTEESKTEEPIYVYVSDESEEDALEKKNKRILLIKLPGNISFPYICVAEGYEEGYLKGEFYDFFNCKYAVPVRTDEKKLRELYLTDAEYEKLNSLIK